MTSALPISVESFESFIQCETKSKLSAQGAVGVDSELMRWQRGCRHRYKESGLFWLRSSSQEREFYVGTPPAEDLKRKRWPIIADYVVSLGEVCADIHALELAPGNPGGTRSFYRPIRFVPGEKLTGVDKLLLAFDALAISSVTGTVPPNGKIIHGSKYRAALISLTKLVGKVRTFVEEIAAQRVETTPPVPILNKHCAECRFRSYCQRIALDKDDLSLLPTVTAKERKTLNDKGVFTVTQLSYTFRPRRNSVRASKKFKHEAALKALAIRKKQVHVVGTPVWSDVGHPVYFDVEGVPDRDFYYLIGLRYLTENRWTHRSFWADNPSDEKFMWKECLGTLAQIHQPRLIHYGSYETQFLRRMHARYSDASTNPGLADLLISSSLNLVSYTYAQIYFPTYSNSLKEVARFLGCEWSERDASGLRALMWRSEWEASRDSDIKRIS